MDELAERDGQTIFELHVRIISWHGTSLSRQALSKHLSILEKAGLVRTEWRWRSKHHFLEISPISDAWKMWLGAFVEADKKRRETNDENCRDERAG